jgi:hypothetical protein
MNGVSFGAGKQAFPKSVIRIELPKAESGQFQAAQALSTSLKKQGLEHDMFFRSKVKEQPKVTFLVPKGKEHNFLGKVAEMLGL